MSDWIKLSELVGLIFTVKEVNGFKYKMWDAATRKMSISDTPTKGHRKIWQVTTDKGKVDVSNAFMGQLASGAMERNGDVKVVGTSFELGSNGQTGKEIRYFANKVENVGSVDAGMSGMDEAPPF